MIRKTRAARSDAIDFQSEEKNQRNQGTQWPGMFCVFRFFFSSSFWRKGRKKRCRMRKRRRSWDTTPTDPGNSRRTGKEMEERKSGHERRFLSFSRSVFLSTAKEKVGGRRKRNRKSIRVSLSTSCSATDSRVVVVVRPSFLSLFRSNPVLTFLLPGSSGLALDLQRNTKAGEEDFVISFQSMMTDIRNRAPV